MRAGLEVGACHARACVPPPTPTRPSVFGADAFLTQSKSPHRRNVLPPLSARMPFIVKRSWPKCTNEGPDENDGKPRGVTRGVARGLGRSALL